LHNNRPLEILCLDHNLRLCSNCALFGEHKNHNIINEEDYLKELEIKAEVLIDFYELIDKNCSNLDINFLNNNNFHQNTIKNNVNNCISAQHSIVVENLEKGILGIEKLEKIEKNNSNNENNNFSSDNNLNKHTADFTENISAISHANPKDFFDDLSIKAYKKNLELKIKIDNYFSDINKALVYRQNLLIEKVSGFFEQINFKIQAYSNIPNELNSKTDIWKQNVKNYFEMFNEITEKDDAIFKIIDSKVNSQDFIASAEQILDEYIKLKNFPFKELIDLIENAGVEMDKYEDYYKGKDINLYKLFVFLRYYEFKKLNFFLIHYRITFINKIRNGK